MIMPSATKCGSRCRITRILNGPGLTFVGVANHVLFSAGTLANRFPFHAGRKTGAAQSGESAGFELRDGTLKIAGLDQFAKRAVFLPARIGIGLQHRTRRIRRHVRHLAAAQCCEYQGFALRLRNTAINMIVDRKRRGAVALAQAGSFAHPHVAIAHRAETLAQPVPQLIAATQVAGHIATDFDVGLRRGCQMVHRIEARDSVNPVQGNPGAFVQRHHLVCREITVLLLDLHEIFD
jgi:hypothetical protein